MKQISWSHSECFIGNGYLHNYKIIQEYPNAVMEICTRCKDLKVFKAPKGKVHNLTYLSYHLKQALPKNHKLYKREYANK